MNDVVVASSDRDAAAAAAVEQHHAEMVGILGRLVEALVAAAARHDLPGALAAKDHLVGWCERDLVPHALAEEKAMYPAAHETAEGRLLVTGMLAEHGVIVGQLRAVAEAPDPVRAGAAAQALLVMFQSHLAKENELVLPLLAGRPDVSVADLLDGMHELLGGEPDHAHHCDCGETDEQGYPELDVRAVPHAIRHAAVLGALEATERTGGLVLIASHDPKPLLAQIEQRFDGAFTLEYLESGPEAWRIALVRRGAKGRPATGLRPGVLGLR